MSTNIVPPLNVDMHYYLPHICAYCTHLLWNLLMFLSLQMQYTTIKKVQHMISDIPFLCFASQQIHSNSWSHGPILHGTCNQWSKLVNRLEGAREEKMVEWFLLLWTENTFHKDMYAKLFKSYHSAQSLFNCKPNPSCSLWCFQCL